jgi:hypothetical protein
MSRKRDVKRTISREKWVKVRVVKRKIFQKKDGTRKGFQEEKVSRERDANRKRCRRNAVSRESGDTRKG